MLPLIVIGADDTVMQAFERHPEISLVIFRPDAETAAHALNDALSAKHRSGWPVSDFVDFDEARGAWAASVAYGPKAFGPAVTGQPERLAHTGWTFVLDHGISQHDPSAPRRVYEGAPEGIDHSTIVWQAAGSLHANFVVDVTGEPVAGFPSPLAWAAAIMTNQVEP